MKVVVLMSVFVFACSINLQATTPNPKAKPHVILPSKAQTLPQQTKDCVKHPQIVKPMVKVTEKSKTVIAEKSIKVVSSNRSVNSISHYSVLNFINFLYTKDTLDNLRVL